MLCRSAAAAAAAGAPDNVDETWAIHVGELCIVLLTSCVATLLLLLQAPPTTLMRRGPSTLVSAPTAPCGARHTGVHASSAPCRTARTGANLNKGCGILFAVTFTCIMHVWKLL
jgi:hypothetical protein